MRRALRILSGALLAVYLGDLFLKKWFLADFYGAYALPETAAYLFLFFAVGCFVLSIIRYEDGSKSTAESESDQ